MLKSGIAYVPQGNRAFADLSVCENLEMAGVILSNRRSLNQGIECALNLFPDLKPKLRQRAGTLSGGEQQMLALGNALALSPKLLLLDEPSLGLAPRIVSEAFERIKEINISFGTSVLIVEQKVRGVREVLRIASHAYVVRNGRVSFSGSTEDLADEATLREVYL
jgi:branched-chain amino acid transport system ATP-binding protein